MEPRSRALPALLLALLAAALLAAASEAVDAPSAAVKEHRVAADLPSPVGTTTGAAPVAPTPRQQGDKKKVRSWPRGSEPPDTAQIYRPSLSPYLAAPDDQALLPASYFLLPGNYYAPPAPPTTEFRSEHYAYPFEPSYAYPVHQPQLDSSLIPTAKHFVIVSFIGLLLLFALVQNSIAAAKRKDAIVEVLSSRRKRQADVPLQDYLSKTPGMKSALKEDARAGCIQRTLCHENRVKPLEDLGAFGKVFAKYLTTSVQSSLKEQSAGSNRLVGNAADAGSRGEDCSTVYKNCKLGISNDKVVNGENEE